MNAEAPEILISSKEEQTGNMAGVLPAVSLSACCTQAGAGGSTSGHQDIRREQTGPATGARSSRPGPRRADPAQARGLNTQHGCESAGKRSVPVRTQSRV